MRRFRSTFAYLVALAAGLSLNSHPFEVGAQTNEQPKGIDPQLLEKANAGDARSQVLVGLAYEGTYDRQPGAIRALDWYRKAAESGDPTAQFLLGWEYHDGIATEKDYKQADIWFRRASKQSNRIDPDLAGKYPMISSKSTLAQSGIGEQFFYIGFLYQEGEDLPQDFAQAATWYLKAAKLGHSAAQSQLGVFYSQGKGVPQDFGQAIYWYSKAGDQGDAVSQFFVGTFYLDGRGVPQDYKQAIEWLTRAAARGEPHAQYNLAILYWRGEGVPENDFLAYVLFDLAAATLTGSDLANATKGRDACAAQLTPEVLSRAQATASKWFADHPSKPK